MFGRAAHGRRRTVAVVVLSCLAAGIATSATHADSSPEVITGTVAAPALATMPPAEAQFAKTILDYCLKSNILTFQPASLLVQGGQIAIVPSVCATAYESAPSKWNALQARIHPPNGSFDAVFGVRPDTLDEMTHGARGFEICNSLAFVDSSMCRFLPPFACSADNCGYDEIDLIQQLAPFLLNFGFSPKDAFLTGRALYDGLQAMTAFGDTGCPSGTELGMMPAEFRATDVTTGQLIYVEKPYCHSPPTEECESVLQRLATGDVNEILDYITDPAGFSSESACRVVEQIIVPDVGPNPLISDWNADRLVDFGMEVIWGEDKFGDPTEPTVNEEFFAEEPLADAEVQQPGPSTALDELAATRTITVAEMLAAQAAFATGPVSLGGLVTRNASATSLVSSSTYPSVVGQSVTYSASISPASSAGPITFADDLVPIPGCESQAVTGGSATCTVTYTSAASHHITASFAGDASLTPSSSPGTIVQVVAPADTATAVSSSLARTVAGQPLQLTASVAVQAPGAGMPTGTVTFYDGVVALGSAPLNGGTASLQTAFAHAGSHVLTASYSGDADFHASTSPPVTEPVDPAQTATVLSSSPDPSAVGHVVQITASVAVQSPGAGTPTGSVDFYDGATKLGSATLTGATASVLTSSLSLGIHTITATYSGSADFAGSRATALMQYVNCDLSAFATLRSRNLSGCFLIHADLAQADLRNDDLRGVNLTGANLTGANLANADLRNAVLAGADLTHANLAHADLRDATGMASAALTGVIWDQTICPDKTKSNKNGGTCVGHL